MHFCSTFWTILSLGLLTVSNNSERTNFCGGQNGPQSPISCSTFATGSGDIQQLCLSGPSEQVLNSNVRTVNQSVPDTWCVQFHFKKKTTNRDVETLSDP